MYFYTIFCFSLSFFLNACNTMLCVCLSCKYSQYLHLFSFIVNPLYISSFLLNRLAARNMCLSPLQIYIPFLYESMWSAHLLSLLRLFFLSALLHTHHPIQVFVLNHSLGKQFTKRQLLENCHDLFT